MIGNGNIRTFEIRDREGKMHRARVLSLAGLREMEKRLGLPWQANLERMSADDAIHMLWLSLKHEGLTEDQVAELFDLDSFVAVIVDALIPPALLRKPGSLDDLSR